MEKKKLVSIIIPVYNSEKYLEKCLTSVIKQSYDNIEIIAIDDGSSDKSLNILNNFSKNDKRIKFIHQENSGAPSARNKGFELSNGDYIIFFDSDDEMNETMIYDMVNNIGDADLIIGNYDIIDEESNIIDNRDFFDKNIEYQTEDFFSKYYYVSPFPNNKMFKSSIIRNHNVRFTNVRIAQDVNFYFKYLVMCNKVAIITNKVCKYRVIEGSISHSYSLKILDITTTFNDIEKFYLLNNKEKYSKEYLPAVKYHHFLVQLGKMPYFNSYKDRIKVYNYFIKEICNIDFEFSKFNFSRQISFLKIKKALSFLICSKTYINIKKYLKLVPHK